MNSIYRFTLDMHSAQSQISIPVMLGDTGRTLRINLSDGSNQYIIADGCLAKISIKRPTGKRLEDFCTIEGNTTIVYQFTDTTCAVEGIHDCDITLYSLDGSIITSPRFSMVVSERVVRSDDIVITDEDQTAVDAMLAEEVKRQAAEAGRARAEAERVANENERIANAEAFAMAVEETKEACESAKESEAYVSRLAPMMGQVDRNSKDIANLKAMIDAELFTTDDTTAYEKTVPDTALPYASVDTIGSAAVPENLFVTLGAIDTSDKEYGEYYDEELLYSVVLRHDADDATIMSFSASPEASEQYAIFSFNLGTICLPSGTYTMRIVPMNASEYSPWLLRLDGVETFEDTGDGITFEWTHGTDEELSISIDYSNADGINEEVVKIMLVNGDTKTPHIPKSEYGKAIKVTEVVSKSADDAVLDTFKIPAEVQALIKYDSDEVDVAHGVHKSFIKTAVLNSALDWSKRGDYFELTLTTAGLPYAESAKRTQATLSGYAYEANTSTNGTWCLSTTKVKLRDSRFTTLEDFVAYIESNPLTLVYTAQTVTETDISAHLSVDNFIRVEGGGTLTFVNEYGLAVPSAVTYQQEVVE